MGTEPDERDHNESHNFQFVRQLGDVGSLDDAIQLVNRVPSSARATDNELMETFERLWEHFEVVELPLVDLAPQVELTASSWLSIVYRQSASTSQLVRTGWSDGAVATARVAFEHAIYLSLIADGRDAIQLLDSLEGKYLTRTKSLVAVLPEGEELTAMWNGMLEDLVVPKNLHWVRDVEQVTKRLETGDGLYWYYRLLSGELHPGLGSIGPYILREMSDRRPAVPPRRIAGVHAMEVAVGACVFAGWAIDEIFGTPLFASVVNPIAQRLDYKELTRLEN